MTKQTNQKPQQDTVRKLVMKTSTIELPGGFTLQHQEPDGENYYTEEMMDEAIKEICEPYMKEERQRVLEEAVRRIELALGADQMGITNKLSKREVLLDLLQALNKLEEEN